MSTTDELAQSQHNGLDMKNSTEESSATNQEPEIGHNGYSPVKGTVIEKPEIQSEVTGVIINEKSDESIDDQPPKIEPERSISIEKIEKDEKLATSQEESKQKHVEKLTDDEEQQPEKMEVDEKHEEKTEETEEKEEKTEEEQEKPAEELSAGEEGPASEKGRKRASAKKSRAKKSPAKKSPAAAGPDGSPEKKPERSPRKPRKITEETVGESHADAEGDKTPLLEAPLIVEGKRSRQRVERLDSKMLSTPVQKELEVPVGKGTKLTEITFIDAMITKTNSTDLKLLHKLIYNRVGTPPEIKKNLRQFCGFDFDNGTKEYDRKKKQMDNINMKDMRTVCGILGLEKGGKKEELVDLVLSFLMNPEDKGKKAPQPVAAKRKRGSSSPRKRASSGKRSGSSKKPAASSEEDGGQEDDHGEDDEKSEKEDEPEEPSPKRAKKLPKTVSTPAPSSSKRGQPSRSAKKSSFPTDVEIKTIIKELLKGVNLEEVTMKEMTAKVCAKYPNIDMASKKDFIKETVKTLLSASD